MRYCSSKATTSVAPFTWSHAQVISVVRGYLDSLRNFRSNAVEKSAREDEKNAPDNPVDKPTSFT